MFLAKPSIFFYLRLAIIGTILACVADCLLLYVPYGKYELWDYAFFKDISQTRLYIGHFLGILFIPLELLGFMAVHSALEAAPNWRIRLIILLTITMSIWGIAYHAMLGFVASFIHFAAQQNLNMDIALAYLQTIRLYFEPFGNLVFVLFALMSLLMAHTVWQFPTKYPRWAAWGNPFFVYLLLVAIYSINKPFGSALIVAGFNLAVLVWLLITYRSIKANS